MLYLDYSRQPGDSVPNMYGGNKIWKPSPCCAVFNELAHKVPGAMTIAEESTEFAGMSRQVFLNGLGFTMKWNMGWMHDMFDYFEKDPIHRKYPYSPCRARVRADRSAGSGPHRDNDGHRDHQQSGRAADPRQSHAVPHLA